MKILFICYRFNSLAQRLYCELTERGHEVSIELDVHPELTIEAFHLYKPDIVIAPSHFSLSIFIRVYPRE